MEIVCPSGLRGEIRKLKVKELALLSDAKLARTGRMMNEIVHSCWLRTTNPGPYMLPNAEALPPPTMLLHADRTFIFTQIRIATSGAQLAWELSCPNDTCSHRFEAVVDLEKLEVQKLPERGKAHIAQGVPFESTVAGRRVLWRLLRAGDDERLLKYMDSGIPITTAGYMCRIVDVSGVDGNDIDALRAWTEELDVDVNLAFQTAMDEVEPSIQQKIDVLCSRCDTKWASLIPLVQAFLSRVTPKVKNALMSGDKKSSEVPSSSPGITPKLEVPE